MESGGPPLSARTGHEAPGVGRRKGAFRSTRVSFCLHVRHAAPDGGANGVKQHDNL